MSNAAYFLERLDALMKRDTGAKAALKRSLGKGVNEASMKALLAYSSIAPKDFKKGTEFIWFEVACMYAACDGVSTDMPFAKALNVLNLKMSTDGLDAKFLQLLSTPILEESLALPLFGQMVKRLHNKGIGFNFEKLLYDLLAFYEEDTKVKLNWAKQYKDAV